MAKKLRVDIDTRPDTSVERSVSLLKRPASKVFARRFRPDDVERWKRAAADLNMSDTEFVERVMNAAASAVILNED